MEEEEEEEDEDMEDGEDGGEEKEEEPITKAKDKGKAVGGRVPIFGTMWKTLEDMFMCDSSKVVSMDPDHRLKQVAPIRREDQNQIL
jgi:hypothetical protein